jgi:DNA-binding Lrp family transcriptional regulator
MENKETEKMLELLEKDSTMPIDELADLLSLPVEKAQALKDKATHEGLIIGYQAVIDWDKVADELASALIEVKVTPAKGIGFDKVAHEISKFDEVSAVYLMSGGYDFAVMLERKSMKEISAFVFEKLATLPSISSTATHFILRKYKDHKIILDKEDEDKRVERPL